MFGRRAFLALPLVVAATGVTAEGEAMARARTPMGGRLSLHVPWPIGPIDPHRLDDPIAALFGEALFDSLYAQQTDGTIVPSLAEGDPEPEGASLRVKLRAGLKTAREKPLGTKDAAASIARARANGAKGWLADIPAPRDDGKSLVFPMKDAARLVKALASPVVAIVPAAFDPNSPDGTGGFRHGGSAGTLALTRNRLAARGPSFLDAVTIASAPKVETSLLAFEAGTDDLGWLESGLHEPRPGSKIVDYGFVGWAVLSTGTEAKDWDGPGIAQRIADGIPFSRLASLHLGAAWPVEPEQAWGGPPVSLYVREDAPWLVAVANAIATTITRPSHDVTVKPVPASEILARRASRSFGLVLDTVRSISPGGLGALVSLATHDSVARAIEVASHPPKLGDVPARTLTRTLRCGVVGELRPILAKMPDVTLVPSGVSGIDLAASYRARAR